MQTETLSSWTSREQFVPFHSASAPPLEDPRSSMVWSPSSSGPMASSRSHFFLGQDDFGDHDRDERMLASADSLASQIADHTLDTPPPRDVVVPNEATASHRPHEHQRHVRGQTPPSGHAPMTMSQHLGPSDHQQFVSAAMPSSSSAGGHPLDSTTTTTNSSMMTTTTTTMGMMAPAAAPAAAAGRSLVTRGGTPTTPSTQQQPPAGPMSEWGLRASHDLAPYLAKDSDFSPTRAVAVFEAHGLPLRTVVESSAGLGRVSSVSSEFQLSRGVVFVNFADVRDADRAKRFLASEIRERAPQTTTLVTRGVAFAPPETVVADLHEWFALETRRVVIAGMDLDTKECNLRAVFQRNNYGAIESVHRGVTTTSPSPPGLGVIGGQGGQGDSSSSSSETNNNNSRASFTVTFASRVDAERAVAELAPSDPNDTLRIFFGPPTDAELAKLRDFATLLDFWRDEELQHQQQQLTTTTTTTQLSQHGSNNNQEAFVSMLSSIASRRDVPSLSSSAADDDDTAQGGSPFNFRSSLSTRSSRPGSGDLETMGGGSFATHGRAATFHAGDSQNHHPHFPPPLNGPSPNFTTRTFPEQPLPFFGSAGGGVSFDGGGGVFSSSNNNNNNNNGNVHNLNGATPNEQQRQQQRFFDQQQVPLNFRTASEPTQQQEPQAVVAVANNRASGFKSSFGQLGRSTSPPGRVTISGSPPLGVVDGAPGSSASVVSAYDDGNNAAAGGGGFLGHGLGGLQGLQQQQSSSSYGGGYDEADTVDEGRRRRFTDADPTALSFIANGHQQPSWTRQPFYPEDVAASGAGASSRPFSLPSYSDGPYPPEEAQQQQQPRGGVAFPQRSIPTLAPLGEQRLRLESHQQQQPQSARRSLGGLPQQKPPPPPPPPSSRATFGASVPHHAFGQPSPPPHHHHHHHHAAAPPAHHHVFPGGSMALGPPHAQHAGHHHFGGGGPGGGMGGGGAHSQQHDYAFDFDRVASGTDQRTTLMVRNIPNKYTQQAVLDEINVKFKGCYDFFYLPIDFKNKCNVGYAFINLVDAKDVARFYREFHGRRWNCFRSGKVCAITYARIQGRQAMITRFQNSSLLNESIDVQPRLFRSSGPDKGEPEHFPGCPTLAVPGICNNILNTPSFDQQGNNNVNMVDGGCCDNNNNNRFPDNNNNPLNAAGNSGNSGTRTARRSSSF
eukprot:CAMPEP_0118896598 /NCGR_PEP_ID=MMETSP1166-20130328/4385_1 /TAXON_ID=1104430 /ORGANISM="Chrysoreinhardia sp, Strain CCMP3193" /LENGTH=1178 /DNA_ID=CAMNT_0006835657 /DNA_START=54 /DNA_END=3590 /DNA_ORIENTATION=+